MIASWGITTAWVAFENAIPPHRTEEMLWRASVALMCTAASSVALIVWLLKREIIEPINNQQFASRMGYQAGYADGIEDAEAAQLPAVRTLPVQRTERHGASGHPRH